jgi:integrative and conjugative element protein (TIGR02256 family)
MHFLDTDGEALIEISNSLLTRMRELVRLALPNETGGILIGRYDDSRRLAIVRCLTGPPRDSTMTPTTFYRGVRGIDALLARAWRRGLYYLGEWHFHPEKRPKASWTDKLQMAEFACTSNMRCPEPILLIVGHPKAGGRLAGYHYRNGLRRLRVAAVAG